MAMTRFFLTLTLALLFALMSSVASPSSAGATLIRISGV